MATTDLGKWMITNGGDYDPDATYEKLTMVMYDNSTYITLKTVTGVTPSNDQINYALMARGFDPRVLSSVTAVDTSGALGNAGETVSAQSLVDYLADAVMTKLVEKANISNVQVNDSSKVPSAALAYAMQQQITENEEAITGLNSDLEIKQLVQGQTILNFAIENSNNKVAGFIVQDQGYPTDAPENVEFFVHIYRDHSSTRLLVKLIPYGRTAYSYERSIFQGNWQDDTWRKLSYTQILLSGVALTDSQGYATVIFPTPLDSIPRIFLQWMSDDSMSFSIAKPINISETGFIIRALRLEGTEIVANSGASVSWIAVA